MSARTTRPLLAAAAALQPATARAPAQRLGVRLASAPLRPTGTRSATTSARPHPAAGNAWARTAAGSALGLGALLGAYLAVVGSASDGSSARTLHLDAPPGARVGLLPAAADTVVKDPATGTELPATLSPPLALRTAGSTESLTLLGLGVRTVSFLKVRVYVAGVYVDGAAFERSRAALRQVEGAGTEAVVKALLDAGVPFVVRIVPVRNTDFNHLRDGFTRSVQARLKAARKAQTLDPQADEQLAHSLQSLKALFPPSSLTKGDALDLVVHPQSAAAQGPGPQKARMALSLEHKAVVLGTLDAPPAGSEAARDGWSVARELVLAYVADKNEISTPVKASVTDGLQHRLSIAAK